MVPFWPDLAFARLILNIRLIFDRSDIGEHIEIVLHAAVYFLSNEAERCDCFDWSSPQKPARCSGARRAIRSKGFGFRMLGVFMKNHVEVTYLRRKDIFGSLL